MSERQSVEPDGIQIDIHAITVAILELLGVERSHCLV